MHAAGCVEMVTEPDNIGHCLAGSIGTPCFFLVDLPLSVVGDTLTLPLAGYIQAAQAPYQEEIKLLGAIEGLE
jgi:hypothetical protein